MEANILGYTVNDELPAALPEDKWIINTINPLNTFSANYANFR